MNEEHKELREILEELIKYFLDMNHPYNLSEPSQMRINQAISAILKEYVKKDSIELERIDIEAICEKVHQAYCQYHKERTGEEYWTKGDYSLLKEDGKEYDRRTVKAVIDCLSAYGYVKKDSIELDEEKMAIQMIAYVIANGGMLEGFTENWHKQFKKIVYKLAHAIATRIKEIVK